MHSSSEIENECDEGKGQFGEHIREVGEMWQSNSPYPYLRKEQVWYLEAYDPMMAIAIEMSK